MTQATVKFAVTGLNHGHIYGQTSSMLDAGAEAACFYAPENDLATQFSVEFSQIAHVDTLEAILEDDSIQLVLNAGIMWPRHGELPLAESISMLDESGYDGWFVFEQEKRWHPNLAEPEVIFPQFVSWIKQQ